MQADLYPEQITVEQFSPFGEIIENKSSTRRQDFDIQFLDIRARPRMWVNRLPATGRGDLHVDVLERHPHSAQTFIPMQPGACLVVVAPSNADGSPDLAGLRAFTTLGGQGITVRPNTWHHGFISLDMPNEVAVVMGYTGCPDDTVIEEMASPRRIRLA